MMNMAISQSLDLKYTPQLKNAVISPSLDAVVLVDNSIVGQLFVGALTVWFVGVVETGAGRLVPIDLPRDE